MFAILRVSTRFDGIARCDHVAALYFRGVLFAVQPGNPAVSGAYLTDITHYLDDKGELPAEMPGPAHRLASFLVLVIDFSSDGTF